MPPTTMEATLQAAGKVIHLGDGSTIPLRVRLGLPPAGRGIILHARRLGSRTFFIYQWMIHCCYCWSFCVLATTISFWHLSSLPQDSSGRSFLHGGANSPPPPLPPHQTPRLPAYLSSDGERKPSGVLLLPDEGKGHIKTVALPHRRCHLTAS